MKNFKDFNGMSLNIDKIVYYKQMPENRGNTILVALDNGSILTIYMKYNDFINILNGNSLKQPK